MRTAYVYNFLIEANIMASIAILLLMVLRKATRKPLGNGALCFGWLLVAVRLLCPLALENPLIGEIRPVWQLDTAVRPISAQVLVRTRDALSDVYQFSRSTLGIAEENPVTTGIRNAYLGMYNGDSAQFLMIVYGVVALALAGWFLFKNVRFRQELKKNWVEPLSGDMLEQYRALCRRMGIKRPLPVSFVDPLPSACLVGLFRPGIVLPLTAAKEETMMILEHELCHYKNGDHIWGFVRLACCLVHWFNPLVWLAARMSRTDLELKCDDRVIRDKDENQKKAYAAVLVMAAARKDAPGLSVMATGMTMTGKRMKERVQQILAGGKAVKALSVAFMVAASMLLVGAFATAEVGGVPFGDERYILPPVPAFQEEMLYHFENVNTDEERIAVAKKLAEIPLMTDIDLMDVEWNVECLYELENAWNVSAFREGELVYAAWFSDDGEIYTVANHHYPWSDEPEEDIYLQVKWRDDAKKFVLDWLEAACPSVAEKVTDVYCTMAYQKDDAAYVYVEAVIEDSYYSGMTATLQVKQDVRIIHIGLGVG